MPINIHENLGDTRRKIARICVDEWDLPNQIDSLKLWLNSSDGKLPKSSYIVDIGFSIREEALGGGAVIDSELIKIFHNTGIEIFLSEYP